MAYKKLIKVSNVCQLLDKSKYPATQTKNGVTFTNNGDGTITANGTCTAENYTDYMIENNLKDKMVIGHKYALFAGNNLANGNIAEAILMFYPRSDGGLFFDMNVEYKYGRVGWILPEGSYSSYSKVYLRILSGATVSNLVFKPQLFDLTEMYGAGHEPTTVEQFRQDFPEAMYDYSPHCWLTSYKRVILTGEGNYLTSYQRNLTCKTKNLFDISKIVPGSVYITFDSKDITCSWYGCSIGLLKNVCPSLKVGDVVTLSFKIKSTTGVAPTIVVIQGQVFNFSLSAVTFTVTEEGLNSNFYFYNTTFENKDVPTTTVFTDIMIELGSTATDYVPYGHL